jgi:hypothetical protein
MLTMVALFLPMLGERGATAAHRLRVCVSAPLVQSGHNFVLFEHVAASLHVDGDAHLICTPRTVQAEKERASICMGDANQVASDSRARVLSSCLTLASPLLLLLFPPSPQPLSRLSFKLANFLNA